MIYLQRMTLIIIETFILNRKIFLYWASYLYHANLIHNSKGHG